MAGKSLFLKTALMKYVFLKEYSSTLEQTNSFYVSLHEQDPTEFGNQLSNEVTYEGYRRIKLDRDNLNWFISQVQQIYASPISDIVFPQCSGGSSNITHFAIGTTETQSGQILYYGNLTPSMTITQGMIPLIDKNTKIIEI